MFILGSLGPLKLSQDKTGRILPGATEHNVVRVSRSAVRSIIYHAANGPSNEPWLIYHHDCIQKEPHLGKGSLLHDLSASVEINLQKLSLFRVTRARSKNLI